MVALVAVVVVKTILPPRWRPDLQLTNTGTNTVTFILNGRAYPALPGQTWHARFGAGDTLSVRAPANAAAPDVPIPLPQRDPKPWSFRPIAQRWKAEVNANDPTDVRIEKRFYEEISAPPSPALPWP